MFYPGWEEVLIQYKACHSARPHTAVTPRLWPPRQRFTGHCLKMDSSRQNQPRNYETSFNVQLFSFPKLLEEGQRLYLTSSQSCAVKVSRTQHRKRKEAQTVNNVCVNMCRWVCRKQVIEEMRPDKETVRCRELGGKW